MRFNRVHAVCERLREKPCDLCPARIKTPDGSVKKGCRLLAEEVINIAVYGNPWGKRGLKKHIKRWRRWFNTETKVLRANLSRDIH